MTSYFDHFIVIEVINHYGTDLFFILFSVLMLYIITNNWVRVIPNRFQLVLEKVIIHWEGVILENLEKKEFRFFIPLFCLFLFIFGVNLLGFFTYTFPVTTHVFITLGVSFGMWLGVIVFGFYNFKVLFLSSLMPSGAPLLLSPLLIIIEIASNISRPVALGMRLAANLTAGHILMTILADFGCKLLFITYGGFPLFPMLIILFMTVLEIGVLVIQAYVFCLLIVIYLKDSIILH